MPNGPLRRYRHTWLLQRSNVLNFTLENDIEPYTYTDKRPKPDFDNFDALNDSNVAKQPETVQDCGEKLANYLFPPDSSVRERLLREVDSLANHEGLRVQLNLENEWQALPWEYCYLPELETRSWNGFLVLNRQFSLVRAEAISRNQAFRPLGDTRQLLFATANDPKKPLDLKTDIQHISEILEDSSLRLKPLHEATWEGLEAALKPGVDFFCFSGHGDEDLGRLLFKPGKDSEKNLAIDSEALAELLRPHKLQFVGLFACRTGQRFDISSWKSLTSILVKQANIPAVLGMQSPILDSNAIAFNKEFFERLKQGCYLDEAISWARMSLYHRWRDPDKEKEEKRPKNGWDWGCPVLYQKPMQGFRLEALPADIAIEIDQDNISRRKELLAGLLVERKELLTNIKHSITEIQENQEKGNYLLLSGASGLGKSSLMATLTADYEKERQAIGYYFVPDNTGGLSVKSSLKQILLHLSKNGIASLAETALEIENVSSKKLYDKLAQAVKESGRSLILCLDGFDFLNNAQQSELLNNLPQYLPPKVVFVISSTLNKKDFDNKGWPIEKNISIEGLTSNEIKDLVRLKRKNSNPEQLANLYKQLENFKLEGYPYYINLTLDLLENDPSLKPSDLPSEMDKLGNLHRRRLDQIRNRIGTQYESLCKPLLQILVIAQESLPLAILAKLSGLAHERARAGIEALSGLVRIEQDNRYRLIHPLFRQFLEDIELDSDILETEHSRFAEKCWDWFRELENKNKNDLNENDRFRLDYSLEHYRTHLSKHKTEINKLYTLLDNGMQDTNAR